MLVIIDVLGGDEEVVKAEPKDARERELAEERWWIEEQRRAPQPQVIPITQ